jgi:protein TonB
VLTASEPLAAPPPPRRWRPWAVLAAVLAHLLAIALLIFLARYQRPQMEALSPNGVSVVFQNGAQASQAPRQAAVPTPQQAPAPPPPPAPPTAPQTAQTAPPEVNLAIPQNLLAPESMPQPQTTPQPALQSQAHASAHPAPHPSTRTRQTQKYIVMNGMSFGSSSAPPVPFSQRDLNLSLPQSDADAVTAPQVSIQGNVGKNWGAAFNKWVYAHLYYPDSAAEQGQQGDVTVQFTAHRDGSVTGLRMTSSSGSPFLDQAWTGIFGQNQLPPFPPGGSDTLNITATVHYELK